MGNYTNNLFKKNRTKSKAVSKSEITVGYDSGKCEVERLECCAIIRHGTLHRGFKSHAELRTSLGDEDAYDQKKRPFDKEGFMTSRDRFVNRREAIDVGELSGQCEPQARDLLSSDILNW